MLSDWASIIELLLVFGTVLGFAFWELYSLRRDKRRSQEAQHAARIASKNGDPNT